MERSSANVVICGSEIQRTIVEEPMGGENDEVFEEPWPRIARAGGRGRKGPNESREDEADGRCRRAAFLCSVSWGARFLGSGGVGLGDGLGREQGFSVVTGMEEVASWRRSSC